ncbi:hypothetical protein KUV22_12320 [Microbulbifer agarilyticus]|uniref:hypothetical protein n=1 Tax=Microbulbifer agarilyticus TaxID=260552 RepID=UPI001C96710E|nr:hypothetical protein [Microbulbifer agarilyticus]MBY6191210.1 hypothetical protein [Microbulbifer agarilyticus]
MSGDANNKPVNDTAENDELQALAEVWQQATVAPPVPDVIRNRIRREERKMRLYALLEWGAAIVVGFCGIYLMLTSEVRDAPWRALLVLVLLIGAMAFSVSNRRGLSAPLEETTQAYLERARLRLVRKRRTLQFAWLLFVAELVILALWQWLSQFGWLEPIFGQNSAASIGLLGVFTLAMAAWSLWYWRRIQRSAQQIDCWQRENKAINEK